MVQRRDGVTTVNVLGPTTIGEATLTARQRTIVAALALQGARGISTDGLVDAVWGEHAPGAARQSLHNHLTRLRRRFGPELVGTEGHLYRLGVPSDVERFEHGLSGRLDRPARAEDVTPLEGALSLWRGTPYEDLDHCDLAGPERARLLELRSQAAEHLAVSRLAAGDQRTAVRDLTGLVDEEPWREHRWVLLALGLHLEGRRADALAVFDRAAEAIGRDLGVEPSSTLRRLRDDIAADLPLEIGDWVEVEAGGRRRCRHEPARVRCDDHRSEWPPRGRPDQPRRPG